MPAKDGWERPSPRVAALMRAVASRLLEDADRGIERVDAASLAAAPPEVREDPALVLSMQASTYANLVHYLGQILADPSVPVRPAHSREGDALAWDLVRRGLDASSLNTFRAGQNAAWELWMQACFALTSDPDELRDLLQYSARSIFTYVDATIAGLVEMVDAERGTLTSTMLTQRLETVSLVLEGAPISIDVASARLGFDLRRTQVGVVFWREPGGERTGELERAADALGRLLGAPRPLTVAASAVSLWAWYALDAEFDASAAAAAVADAPGLRLAVGSVGAGVDGFRRTHFDALTTQRLMMRSALQVAVFADVEVVSLLPLDDETVHEFVERTLGDLASADPTLRETLRVYLREELSPTRAARALYTHRNTVLNRLARAQALLPAPLAGRHLPVALALEVVHWLGSGQREIRRSKPSAILA